MLFNYRSKVPPTTAFINQLKCADIVLLNKIDLISEEECLIVKNLILEYSPEAKVYPTLNSVIELPLILDLEFAESVGVMSHESTFFPFEYL